MPSDQDLKINIKFNGATSVKGDKAQVAKDLALLESIIEEDRIERGVYPSRAQLDTIFDNVEFRRFDPWGADYFAHYILSPNKQAYVLGSPGPDGKVGKAFVDDDLVNGIDDLGEFGLYDDILSTARKE